MNIPDAAVEAAARVMFHLRATEPDQSVPCRDTDWDSLPDSWQEEWRDGARAALAAAAPHLIEVAESAVREQVARDIEEAEVRAVRTDLLDRWGTSLGGRRTMSPHRAHMIVQLVRADAARIARGGAA